MAEIILSLFYTDQQAENKIRQVLLQFEKEFHCSVALRWLNWDTGHTELNRIAFEGRGADVSEIGTTWLGSYINMQVLRPFSWHEIEEIGGIDAFAPVAWVPGQDKNLKGYYAIPWSISLFLIYYRHQWLNETGLDESNAFSSIDSLESTIALLAQTGYPMPITLPDAHSYGILHAITPFVWNEGGYLRSDDGLQVLFDSPEAIRGMARYYDLMRFINPEARLKLRQDSASLFGLGHAATGILPSSYLYLPLLSQPEMAGQWRVAPMPPRSVVGGHSLVVWQHTSNQHLSYELVRFLTSHPVQLEQPGINYHFPARLSALQSSSFSQSEYLPAVLKALKTGHAYPSMRLWGVIEDNLVQALSAVWYQFLIDTNQDVEILLREKLVPLARRLRITLSDGYA
jgi:ABC-type glycerol-3-phosphate transport system substrate-binding protein